MWGLAFMAVGYGMSCLTRVYEFAGPQLEARRVAVLRQQAERNWLQLLMQRAWTTAAGRETLIAKSQVIEDQMAALPNLDSAENPVVPSWEQLKGRSWRDFLVEPPFLAPPRDDPQTDPQPSIDHRPENYWMMGKRGPNLSFMMFASGFAFALYGLFVVACDLGGLSVGIFRTFGTNALAAYFLHHVIEERVKPLVPNDAPLWYCLCGFALFLLLTYACVRYLETRKIYLKL